MKPVFKRKVLKNGMTILFEKRDLPVVSVAFAVRNGGINESEEEKGISHFIEHMLYKGTPFRDSKKIAEDIERNGGELNGNRILEESTVGLIMSDQLPEGASYEENSGYGLAGAVNLETGVYSWAGAASTNFWIDPANDMIIITYAQLMPSDYSYAYVFKDLVKRAMMK